MSKSAVIIAWQLPLLLTVAFVLVGLPSVVYAETAAVNTYRHNLMQRWAWTKENWSGDDTPYQQTMAEIDKSLQEKENVNRLLNNYKGLAGDSPANPVAQFRWAYLGYKMALQPRESGKMDMIGFSVDALARPQSPHSYSYDRLRYLLMHQIGDMDYHLASIGSRLLKHDPQNQAIMLYIIQDLNDSRDDVDRSVAQVKLDRQKALMLAKQYVTRFPSSPGGYSVLGAVYSEMFLSTNNAADKGYAILALKRYEGMVPAGSASFAQTEVFIKRIEDGLGVYNGVYVYKDSLPR